MGKAARPTPNTHLGKVTWYGDIFWGTYTWLAQGLLGMRGLKEKDEDFLNTEKYKPSELFDFFNDIELPNGMLGFDLFADRNWHTLILCRIETTIPYQEIISDQELLNLITDFKDQVRSLPLARPGDGAGTEEEITRALSDGKRFIESIIKAVEQENGLEPLPDPAKNEDEDDLPF